MRTDDDGMLAAQIFSAAFSVDAVRVDIPLIRGEALLDNLRECDRFFALFERAPAGYTMKKGSRGTNGEDGYCVYG